MHIHFILNIQFTIQALTPYSYAYNHDRPHPPRPRPPPVESKNPIFTLGYGIFI